MPCITSSVQAPIQCALRPAMWLPGIKNLHSHTEIWKSEKSVGVVLDAIVKAVPATELNSNGQSFNIRKVDRDAGFVQIYAYTWANWLDVMEFSVEGDTAMKGHACAPSTIKHVLRHQELAVVNVKSVGPISCVAIRDSFTQLSPFTVLSSAQARSFSTGVFPVAIPLSFILNCMAFAVCLDWISLIYFQTNLSRKGFLLGSILRPQI